MKRSSIFTAILIAALVFMAATLAAIMLDNNSEGPVEMWSVKINDTGINSKPYVEDDDTFYFISGKTLHAMGPQGARWNVVLPVYDEAAGKYDNWNMETAVSDNNTIYMSVYPSKGSVRNNWSRGESEIVAVSRSGTILWSRQLNNSQTVKLTLCNERIYAYVNGYSVIAFGKNGRELWRQAGILFKPAFDEGGNMYQLSGSLDMTGVIARSPNGTTAWQRSLADYGVPFRAWRAISYDNGTVYLWTHDSLVAITKDGSLKWVKTSPEGWMSPIYGYLPDAQGRFFVSGGDVNSPIHIITVDGGETILENNTMRINTANIKNGVAYSTDVNDVGDRQVANLYDFQPVKVSAHYSETGEQIWQYTIPAGKVYAIRPDAHEFNIITNSYEPAFSVEANETPADEWYQERGMKPGSQIIKSHAIAWVVPGNNTVYVSYWVSNYEYPFFAGRSNCTYTGGIYALDMADGHLLWSRPTGSLVIDMVERNGTLYYRTADGKLSAIGFGIAAGLAAAAGYLCLHVLSAGTITRARSRIDRNDNRNRLYKLIADRPGSTLHELSRELPMNVGTVRYHLLILSMNHKITEYTDDTKYVRYFTNSNSYSPEEKLIIALLRRESYGRMILVLLNSPGITNMELAAKLGLPESAVSKYLRVLYEKSVVARTTETGQKPTYRISDRFLPIVKACCEKPGIIDQVTDPLSGA
ncbi:PQQ-binding-like beta-propeller repeat protein [Methanocella arvoryzae]|nr:PQQ-binding-like beta-propeller repeat protein [Methanocella arvoryzae]